MSEKNNLNSLHKKLVKNSILKYSNKALFERRERNYNSEQNTKRKIKKMRTTKFFHKKNNKEKHDVLTPFYKTMSSFYHSEKSYNILPLLKYFEKNIMSNKKSKVGNIYNHFICKTDRNCRDKDLFMTEISDLKLNNNDRKINKILLNKKKNNNININKDSNIDILLLFQSSRNQERLNNNENTNYKIDNYANKEKTYYKDYSYTQTEQHKNFWEKTSDEYSNQLLHTKLSKFDNSLKYKDFIKKLKEEKIYLHTSKAKTERLHRLEEAYQSQIEFYKDSIKSFKMSKKLLENDFINRIGDYAKFISTTREREKIKEASLRQQIMDYRQEIEQIKSKINKIEIEKKNIIKWIFLQIQMKEKKLFLPDYYKQIITNNNNKHSSRKIVIKNDEKGESSFSNNRKINKNPTTRQKEHYAFNYTTYKKGDSSNSFNFFSSGINERSIKPEERLRILNYKLNLIYKTPEEFKDRLVSLEKGNLLLLQYKDVLNNQLFKYKKLLMSLKGDEVIFEFENQNIENKESELKNIKQIVEKNEKIVSIFKNKKINHLNKYKENNPETNQQSKQKTYFINESSVEKYKYKNMSLFKSIYIIFERCQMFGCNSSFGEDIINLVKRKINTKEKEMLLMLEFIELTSDYLIMSINKKTNHNNEIKSFVKNLKSEIDNEHKLEKAKLQLMLDLKKINSLEEKIEKRYNKIYFLTKRRKNLKECKIKKQIKIANLKINKNDNIQDFLYNEESSKEQ
jgi:hypothetical protein